MVSRVPLPRKLSTSGIRQRLTDLNAAAHEAPWSVVAGTLRKRFTFEDFRSAFAFMSKVAKAAESLGHHPDWSNSYAKVDVALTTHSAGGLTSLDFDLATRIEAIPRPRERAAKRTSS
jgi:4a-hydroxytetrahydrobiopterin dehydratase